MEDNLQQVDWMQGSEACLEVKVAGDDHGPPPIEWSKEHDSSH